MEQGFADRLELEPGEREKLRSLAARGSDTPFKLLALRKAAPEAFDAFWGGSAGAARLVAQLDTLITDRERALLDREPAHFPTGALDPNERGE